MSFFSEVIYGSWKNIRDKDMCTLCTHPWFSSVYWSCSCGHPVHVHVALPVSCVVAWLSADCQHLQFFPWGELWSLEPALPTREWQARVPENKHPQPMLPHPREGYFWAHVLRRLPGFSSRIAFHLPTVIVCLITHPWLAACLLFITFLLFLEFPGAASQINYLCIYLYLRDWFKGTPN